MLVPIRESYWHPRASVDSVIEATTQPRSYRFVAVFVLGLGLLIAISVYVPARAESATSSAASASTTCL
jgi:hypothetical protein